MLKAAYSYCSDGTKVQAADSLGAGHAYLGSMVYGLDLGVQDFGARFYDSRLCRWTTQDPLAEKYPGLSPYAYCGGDPVMFVDPDGREVITGAIVGASASYIGQVIANAVMRKQLNYTLKQCLIKVDYADIAFSALEGAVTGGLSALTQFEKSAAKATIGAVSGAIQASVDYELDKGLQVNKSVDEIAVGFVAGAVAGSMPETSCTSKPRRVKKPVSNTKAVRIARTNAIKDGKTLSPEEADLVRSHNNEIIPTIQKANLMFNNMVQDVLWGVGGTAMTTIYYKSDEKN